jgi:hypothetical protein
MTAYWPLVIASIVPPVVGGAARLAALHMVLRDAPPAERREILRALAALFGRGGDPRPPQPPDDHGR